MSQRLPHIISFPTIAPFLGKNIVVNEKETLHIFPVSRIYWINYHLEELMMGAHAHKTVEQIVVAIAGKINISLEDTAGNISEFCLLQPNEGLYIPPMYWKKIAYSEPCTLLCLASEEYREEDYIRDYTLFKQTVMQ
jgi:hypothetical protein